MKIHYLISAAALWCSASGAAFSQIEFRTNPSEITSAIGESGLTLGLTATPGYVLVLRPPETFSAPPSGARAENRPVNDSTEAIRDIPSGHSAATVAQSASGGSGYTTGIGLRGGYTSGITLKHFISSNAALEAVVGSRWHGFSLTGLYELHKSNALGVSQLTWVYGIGARVGSYRGDRFYGGGRGRCNNPNDRRCGDYWGSRSLTAVGLVGIGGLHSNSTKSPSPSASTSSPWCTSTIGAMILLMRVYQSGISSNNHRFA